MLTKEMLLLAVCPCEEDMDGMSHHVVSDRLFW